MAGSGSGTRSPQLRTGQGLHVLQHARSTGPASGVLGPHVVQVIWVQQSSQRAHKARPDASPGCGGAAAAAATHLPAKSPGLRPIAPPCPWRTALHTGRRRPACGGFAGAGRRPHRQHRSWPAAAAAPGCCERCQTWWARGRPPPQVPSSPSFCVSDGQRWRGLRRRNKLRMRSKCGIEADCVPQGRSAGVLTPSAPLAAPVHT